MLYENEDFGWPSPDVEDITDRKQISLPVGENENELLQVIHALNDISWIQKIPPRPNIFKNQIVSSADPEIYFYCRIDRLRDFCNILAEAENAYVIPFNQQFWITYPDFAHI